MSQEILEDSKATASSNSCRYYLNFIFKTIFQYFLYGFFQKFVQVLLLKFEQTFLKSSSKKLLKDISKNNWMNFWRNLGRNLCSNCWRWNTILKKIPRNIWRSYRLNLFNKFGPWILKDIPGKQWMNHWIKSWTFLKNS